jgi:hypothetical protein
MPKKVGIALCMWGYHFCRNERDLVKWLGPAIWRVEVRGEIIEGKDKAVAEQVRLLERVETWTDRTARLLAADCAERQLGHLPAGARVICENAIAAARLFADGKISEKDLKQICDAAFSASKGKNCSDAAMHAMNSAGYSAANTNDYSGFNAARDAAHCAAYAAYEGAARLGSVEANAVYAEEGKWQARRLKEYLDGKRG